MNDLHEAKASVSYSLLNKDGYPLIFTVRSLDEAELLDLMVDLESMLNKRGYQPDKKVSGGFAPKVKEVVQGETCPKCNQPLVKFTSKDGTKSGVKCSTAKYDFMTKTASGCNFVRFDESNSSEKATEAQESILKQKGLWTDGMSKADASKTIAMVLGK